MNNTAMGRHAGAFLLCLLALGFGACGSDDDDDKAGARSSRAANEAKVVEKAFLATMVPHHESAIEMARIAKEKGSDPFVTGLADGIVATQAREIAQMKDIHERLLGASLKPDPAGHDRLGLTAAEAGMTHGAHTNSALRAAKPFDRAFVDEMVAHHEGAIRMAGIVLKSTKDAELRSLAQDIVSTQRHEIEQMSSFRSKRFGAPSATGKRRHKLDGGKRDEDGGHGEGHSG